MIICHYIKVYYIKLHWSPHCLTSTVPADNCSVQWFDVILVIVMLFALFDNTLKVALLYISWPYSQWNTFSKVTLQRRPAVIFTLVLLNTYWQPKMYKHHQIIIKFQILKWLRLQHKLECEPASNYFTYSKILTFELIEFNEYLFHVTQ